MPDDLRKDVCLIVDERIDQKLEMHRDEIYKSHNAIAKTVSDQGAISTQGFHNIEIRFKMLEHMLREHIESSKKNEDATKLLTDNISVFESFVKSANGFVSVGVITSWFFKFGLTVGGIYALIEEFINHFVKLK